MLERAGEHERLARKAVVDDLLPGLEADTGRAQQTQLMLRLRIFKPRAQVCRRRRPDVGNGHKLVLRRRHKLVERAEVHRQHLGRLLPHLPDAERAQQARHARILALFNGRDEVLGRFFAHMIQRRDRLRLEGIQLRRRAHEFRLDQRLAQRNAKPVDVHRLAGGEVRDVAQPLRRALRTRAAQSGTVRIAHDRRAALGARVRHTKRDRAIRTLFAHDGEDLGNDLPRLLHEHRVADAQVEIVDEVLIVQRGVRDGRPRQTHRLDDRLRREHARAPDLHDDVAHAALLFLRRVLICHRPAREFCRAAEILPLRKIVDLDDRAVDIERERPAVVADPVDARAAGVERPAAPVRHDREAE